MGGYGAAASAAPAANGGSHSSAGGGGQGGQPMLYDPNAPINTDKLNMAFMHRQLPLLTGAVARLPQPLAAGGV